MNKKLKYNEELHRKILKETLEEGGYQIGEQPNVLFTGKGGKIEYEVLMTKELIKQNIFTNKGYLPEYITYEQ
jgi:hypothetical protein